MSHDVNHQESVAEENPEFGTNSCVEESEVFEPRGMPTSGNDICDADTLYDDLVPLENTSSGSYLIVQIL